MAHELGQRIHSILPQDPRRADLGPIAEQIARFRGDQYVRLASAEFLHVRLERVCAQLSDLADVCVSAALEVALAVSTAQYGPPRSAEGADEGLVAIAMGKYGAQELNFCSDIDLVFIYGTDDGHAGGANGGRSTGRDSGADR